MIQEFYTHATQPKNLTHHFLIASEKMNDERFVDSLVYVCSAKGEKQIFGFIINKPSPFSVGKILEESSIFASKKMMNTTALQGGFTMPEVGHILHTGLPVFASSLAISENVCLTTSKDVLTHIALHKMPNFLLCLGACRWPRQQLEQEILDGKWLICPADLTILFKTDFSERLLLAKTKLGIYPDMEHLIGYA